MRIYISFVILFLLFWVQHFFLKLFCCQLSNGWETLQQGHILNKTVLLSFLSCKCKSKCFKGFRFCQTLKNVFIFVTISPWLSAKLPHPIYTCVYHLALYFQRAYPAYHNQGNLFKTNCNSVNSCINLMWQRSFKLHCHIRFPELGSGCCKAVKYAITYFMA